MTAAALLGIAAALATGAREAAPQLLGLRVASGPTPFAGDRRLLATVSPNHDGVRDVAVVRFRLTSAARVRLEAVATQMVRAGRGGTTVVWRTEQSFGAGTARLAWRPAPSTQPRTYVLRL